MAICRLWILDPVHPNDLSGWSYGYHDADRDCAEKLWRVVAGTSTSLVTDQNHQQLFPEREL